jgi:hypothetical protein
MIIQPGPLPSPAVPNATAGRRLHFSRIHARVILESFLLMLFILGAVVWFVAPYLARDYINRRLSILPDYTGRVESVRIHPWIASMDAYDVHLDKKSGKIPVHFFSSPKTTVSLQWSQIFHGVERASIVVNDPRINLVEGPNPEESQMSISKVWIDTIKELIPWRVNQVQIHNGDVHFLDFHANPQVDLEACHLELDAENMSNSQGLKIPLPATVRVTARPLLTGNFEMNLAVNFDEKFATFTQDFKMEHVPAVGANSALQKYLKVRARSGEIGLYSQLASDKGSYLGYVKPFFYRLEFEPKASDQGNPGAIWSGVLNLTKGLFENDDHVIATQSKISGRVDQPDVDTLAAVTGILRNAYVEALRTGFDPTHSPTPPVDTVTTPLTASSAKEATNPSPAAKY